MTIIRYLDESDKMIKPLNISEWFEIYSRCRRNIEWACGLGDYMLLEIGLFWSCESNSSFASDNDSLSYCSLPGKS